MHECDAPVSNSAPILYTLYLIVMTQSRQLCVVEKLSLSFVAKLNMFLVLAAMFLVMPLVDCHCCDILAQFCAVCPSLLQDRHIR